MNNGNLLNSLLGATSNNAVATKNTAAKNRAESSEKFRDALEQARPEVAAPKARKTDQDIPRKADVPRTREDSAPVRAKSSAAQDKSATRDTNLEKANTRKDNRQEPAVTKSDKVNQAEPEQHTQGDKDCAEGTDVAAQTEDAITETSADAVLVSPEIINPFAQSLVIPAEAVEGADIANGLDLSPLKLQAEGVLSGESDLSTDTTIDQTTLLVTPAEAGLSLQQGITDAAANTNPDLVDSEAGAIIAVATTVNTNALPADQRTNTSSAVSSTLSTANLQNAAVQQLAVDGAVSNETATDAEGSVDAGDNPDFFTLLNTKAGLAKLMDSPAATDKAALVDSAKPALTSAVLAEPLTARLTETQSPAARSFVAQTGVPVPVGQPQWSQAVGEKVLWLAAQNISAAEIRLDPPDLGQLHVKVSVNQDQATVTFTSPHPVVREALDQQLNRLREMFSEQGLNLVNVDVSDRSGAQQQQEQGQGTHAGASAEIDDEELLPVAVTQVSSLRLVDHYA